MFDFLSLLDINLVKKAILGKPPRQIELTSGQEVGPILKVSLYQIFMLGILLTTPLSITNNMEKCSMK